MNWLQRHNAKRWIEKNLQNGKVFFPKYSSLELKTSDNSSETASLYDVPRSVWFNFSSPNGWMLKLNYISGEDKSIVHKVHPDVWCIEGKNSKRLQKIISINPKISVQQVLIAWLEMPRDKFNRFHYMALTDALTQVESKYSAAQSGNVLKR